MKNLSTAIILIALAAGGCSEIDFGSKESSFSANGLYGFAAEDGGLEGDQYTDFGENPFEILQLPINLGGCKGDSEILIINTS